MNNSRLIGHIYSSKFQFYNTQTRQVEFKDRPVLIIGIEKENGPCDLTVLPLSSVSKKENLLPKYDVEIIYNSYPLTGLSSRYPSSYCRTSKVTTISSHDLGLRSRCDLKSVYPNLYSDIQSAYNEYQQNLF